MDLPRPVFESPWCGRGRGRGEADAVGRRGATVGGRVSGLRLVLFRFGGRALGICLVLFRSGGRALGICLALGAVCRPIGESVAAPGLTALAVR